MVFCSLVSVFSLIIWTKWSGLSWLMNLQVQCGVPAEVLWPARPLKFWVPKLSLYFQVPVWLLGFSIPASSLGFLVLCDLQYNRSFLPKLWIRIWSPGERVHCEVVRQALGSFTGWWWVIFYYGVCEISLVSNKAARGEDLRTFFKRNNEALLYLSGDDLSLVIWNLCLRSRAKRRWRISKWYMTLQLTENSEHFVSDCNRK